MTSEKAIRPALLAALLLVTACFGPRMDTPAGFLHLKADDWRAVSSDDARIWLREFDDPERGSLEFWSKTLLEDLTRNRGYEPAGEEDVTDAKGRKGRVLEFTATIDGERCGYLIAIWALDGDVCTAEFTAREDVYAAHEAAVRRALPTIRWSWFR